MKASRSLLFTTFSVFLGLALMSAADAGAIFRHAGSEDQDQSSDQSRTTQSQSDKGQTTRSRSDNNGSGQDTSSRDRSGRGTQSGQAQSTGSPTTSGTTDRTSLPTLHPDRRTTTAAGPTYRIPDSKTQNDRSRQENRTINSSGNVSRRGNTGHDRGTSVDTRTWNHDNSKYGRVEERPTFRAPKRVNGHYSYDYGWVNVYNYPCTYAYWVFDDPLGNCCRSVYYYYDYFPYVPQSRIIIVSRPRVVYVEVPVVVRASYDDDYYLNRHSDGISETLSDIRLAWENQDADMLLRHVRSDTRVDVTIDGAYSYTLDGSDYRDMTRDAIGAINTIDFRFDSVKKRGDGSIVAYGRHEFYSGYGDRKVTYVSYVFERRGSQWVIVEAGSSQSRLDR